jgi:hypothetical protein
MSEEPADSAWTGTYNLTASALTQHGMQRHHYDDSFISESSSGPGLSLELDHNESKLLRIINFLVLVLVAIWHAAAMSKYSIR